MIFEKQTPQSVSFQGEEGPVSAWGVAQELDSKSSDPVTLHTSVSCGHLLSCPLTEASMTRWPEHDGQNQSLTTGLVLSAYQLLKFN